MKKDFKALKWLSLVLVMALLAVQLVACTGNTNSSSASQDGTTDPANTTTPISQSSESYDTIKAYLATYFDIDTETSWDTQTFSAALKTIAGEEAAKISGNFSAVAAMKAVVISSAYDELAKSYTEEKIAKNLAKHGITDDVPGDSAAHIACGLDTGILRAEEVSSALKGDELRKEYAAELLMSVAESLGAARNFIGYSNEPTIHTELVNVWNSFAMFDQPELVEIGNTSVQSGITTGYNLKDGAYAARFLPELTIQYGHSNIKHAHQLLGLLESEDITVKVQLEPKISVFQYLLDWGPVPEPSDTYEVIKYSDELYLAFAVEYDLLLEFATNEEMLRFDQVIKDYAKKNEGNEDAVGLIHASWWQPLYTTTNPNMPSDNYTKIYDCVVSYNGYSIHPFCLEENLDTTLEQLNAINPDLQVDPVARYSNTAFHNYMTGSDYQ